jgi:hypothetical protein
VKRERHSDPEERTYEVAREPKSIEGARRFAEQALGNSDSACREAVAMAVLEFAENLAKYGAPDEDAAGTIAISVRDAGVRIRVSNVSGSREDAERVMEMVQEIGSAPNLRELYRIRHQELFLDPSLPHVRLGLLRVAFEGGFRLSSTYVSPVLEIIAERPLARCDEAAALPGTRPGTPLGTP